MVKKQLKVNRYYKRLSEQNNWIKFPLSWCVRFDLSPLDVVVFAIVDVATKDGKMHTFVGSIESICTRTNTSKPTVRRSLEKLVARGFIRKENRTLKDKNTGESKTWVCYTSKVRFDPDRSIEEQCEIELIQRETLGIKG